MKVVLIKPPQETNEIQPPLGLGYLASSIKDLADVEIIDAIKDNLNIKKIVEKVTNKKFDIIGFQCYTVDFNTVKKTIKQIKKINSDSIIIVGGPHPTLDPINTLKNTKADYIFLGDSEISFYKFVMAGSRPFLLSL